MKKIYLVLFIFTISLLSYGQSPIVTIDRDNIVGPTLSGSEPTISSVGLTRGAGINIRTGGTNFTSRDWDATSLAEARTNDEYMEWSVSANASNEVEITRLNIRLRTNTAGTGPANWRIFYSLDGFATAGVSVIPVQTTPTTGTNFNFTGLSIPSGTAGTITFRLYAWSATNAAGWLRVLGNGGWSDFGISTPGIRMFGNIVTTTPNSIESNIIAATGFTPPQNINYNTYNVASGLTTENAIKIGEFVIQDGGDDLTDADNLPTILSGLGFNVTGHNNLAALAIFDGATNVSEITTVDAATNFSGLNLVAPDSGSKTFSVYATFGTTVTDNEQIQLVINSATPNVITGSAFEVFDAGGASTSIADNDNRIEVTATKVIFDQQPTDVNQLEIMTPYPTILAVDINNNLDADYSGLVQVGSFGSLNPPSINYNINNGIGIFNTIKFSNQGTNIQLVVNPSDFGGVFSTSFNVIEPIVSIAIQDFDSTSPQWNYTNSDSFFDNGWGISGYFGVIDVSNASPVNYPYFSNNILGENNLHDGITGFSSIMFDAVDISDFTGVQVRFDWQVIGYDDDNDDAQYQLYFDGIAQGFEILLDGELGITNDSGTIKLDVPDTVTSVSLEIRIRNNGINGYSGFDNFKVVSVFDGLIYTNNAWIPATPSNTTGALNAFVKDGTYTVGSNVELNNLYVSNDAAVAVAPTKSILLNSDLYSNGTFLLESASASYSSLIVAGSSTGNVSYNRHVNSNAGVGGNDLISAPVTGQTFANMAANNSNLFSNPSNPTEKLFGPFDKVTGSYLTYDTNVPLEAAVVLNAGVGYRAATTDNGKVLFTGNVNTGNVNVPIVIGGPITPEWNLVGNPYPSYLKLSDFLAANNSQFSATSSGVYGYDGNAADGWQIWNQAYSEANPNKIMAPGQGFYVSSGAASGVISFTPIMRSIGEGDDFIPGRLAENPIEHLQLSLNSADKSYKTDFYFTDNASLSLDPGYDSRVFGGSAPAFSIYSNLVQDNAGIAFAIQSLGYSDFADITIPLGVQALQGQALTFSISESSLPESTHVYLEDTVVNTVTLLNEGNYTLTSASNISGVGRFFLRFSDSALSTDDIVLNSLHVFATATPKAIFVKGHLTETTFVKVYDIQGRLVLSSTLDAGTTSNQIDVSELATGVYAVAVSNKTLIKTQKIIIK